MATDMSDLAKGRAYREGQPRGLLFEPAPGARIWVRSWAEVLAECKHRLRLIRDQLEYDPDADQAVAYVREPYPDYVPHHLAAAGASDTPKLRAPGQDTV